MFILTLFDIKASEISQARKTSTVVSAMWEIEKAKHKNRKG